MKKFNNMKVKKNHTTPKINIVLYQEPTKTKYQLLYDDVMIEILYNVDLY